MCRPRAKQTLFLMWCAQACKPKPAYKCANVLCAGLQRHQACKPKLAYKCAGLHCHQACKFNATRPANPTPPDQQTQSWPLAPPSLQTQSWPSAPPGLQTQTCFQMCFVCRPSTPQKSTTTTRSSSSWKKLAHNLGLVRCVSERLRCWCLHCLIESGTWFYLLFCGGGSRKLSWYRVCS